MGKDHPTIDFKKTFVRFRGRKKTNIESTLETETLHTYTTTMGETTFEANANLPTLLPYWVLLHAAEGAIARAKLLAEHSWDMGG